MRAGVTLFGMTTTLRCTCHLKEVVRLCLCMQSKNNEYLFWLTNNLWQQRCHFCEIKIPTGGVPCIVLGPGVSKLKQDSNN